MTFTRCALDADQDRGVDAAYSQVERACRGLGDHSASLAALYVWRPRLLVNTSFLARSVMSVMSD